MADDLKRRPIPALPFTILTEPDTIRLIAGEDFRYTLRAPGLDQWGPQILSRCDGEHSLQAILNGIDSSRRATAQQLIERLYGERALVDAPAPMAHSPCAYAIQTVGTGPLADQLRHGSEESDAPGLTVICQDRLDYHQALELNRQCLRSGSPWLWASSGPLSRAYVSPVFLPDAGPCLCCLLSHFQALSPAPELYSALIAHAHHGLSINPVVVPPEAETMLRSLVQWKVRLLSSDPAPAELYRLHVLEISSMELTTYPVLRDPECPDCGAHR